VDTTIESIPSPQAAPPEPAQVVLVLGMHRSGTSALSRVLNLLGVDLGHDLMAAVPDNNETGFWEHRAFQSFNQMMFESVGRQWDSVLPLPDQWWKQPQVEGFTSKLRDVMQAEFSQSRLWGVKDPRICFMMPLWRSLLGEMNCEPRCVLIFRNPIEVARSLEKRDRLPASQSYLMWLRSFVKSEQDTRDLPRTMTTYESILTDWKAELARISEDLKITWPTSMDAAAPAVEEFLRPSLRHYQADNQQILNDPQIPELVRRAYSAILTAVDSGQIDDLSSTVDEIGAELEKTPSPLINYVADLEQKYHSKLDEQIAVGKRFVTERNGLQSQIASAQSMLAATQAVLIAEQSAFWAERSTSAKLGAALTIEQGITAQLRINLAAERTALAEHRVTVETLREDSLHLQSQLAQSQAETADAQTQLNDSRLRGVLLNDLLEQIWRSRSWRWTKLLRGRRSNGLTERRLMPAASVECISPQHFRTTGCAHFFLPCAPIAGPVTIQLKMSSSIPSRARLYFDTGKGFNSEQSLDLGAVGGENDITCGHVLSEPVLCFRLDPVQDAADFTIERFEIAPLKTSGTQSI
jgi:hypothetical protein